MYLFTHAFDGSSPVCSGINGYPIPIYQLGFNEVLNEKIYGWKSSYTEYDKIWLGSDELEVPIYKQLATPNSKLSITGRNICKLIEKKTELPTYYYLMRYWGRSKKESKRSCPSCGNKWHKSGITKSKGISWFDFQCHKCRLVSHVASNIEGNNNSVIGEYVLVQRET